MYCSNCGNKIKENANFCEVCGKQLNTNHKQTRNFNQSRNFHCPNCRSEELYPVQLSSYNFHLEDDELQTYHDMSDKHFWKCRNCSETIMNLEDINSEIRSAEQRITSLKRIRSVAYFIVETITLLIYFAYFMPRFENALYQGDGSFLFMIFIVDILIGGILTLIVYSIIKKYINESSDYIYALNQEKAFLLQYAYYVE